MFFIAVPPVFIIQGRLKGQKHRLFHRKQTVSCGFRSETARTRTSQGIFLFSSSPLPLAIISIIMQTRKKSNPF